jgi:hypothetical protein
MNRWSLDSFLQEHYTASRASAGTLSAYLIDMGANARDSQQRQSELTAPPANQRNRSTLRPAPDSRASVDSLSAFLFGVGGTAPDSRHKRSELIAPTRHWNQSALRPPADIPNR